VGTETPVVSVRLIAGAKYAVFEDEEAGTRIQKAEYRRGGGQLESIHFWLEFSIFLV